MAIDTAERRKNAAAVASVWLIPGVTPNSSKDGEWRQQSGWGYGGILVGAAVEVTIFVGPKWKASVARRKKIARRR